MISGTGTVTGCSIPSGHPEPCSGAGTAPHRSTELPLGPLPTAAASARAHAAAVAVEWGFAALADDLRAIVSELVSNAANASMALPDLPAVGLRLRAEPRSIVIEVWDESPADPEPSAPDTESETGRGLLIVDELSARWGTERFGYRQKVVWSEVALPPQSLLDT